MDFKEQVYSVLFVSAAEKFNTSVRELFPEYRYHPLHFALSINDAKRALIERDFDFIIINSPLPDEDGIRFSIDICGNKQSVVMIMVRNELYHSFYDKVSSQGVYLLSKPTSKPIVSTALDWMATTRERLKKLEKKTLSLEEKMQEIRIVNRAKWILITELKMTETDAHRYIEKQAMDRCVSKKEIAEEIIKTYA